MDQPAINKVLNAITTTVITAIMVLLYAVRSYIVNLLPQTASTKPAELETEEEPSEAFSDMLASIMEKREVDHRKVRPFSYHMDKYFDERSETTRTEVIENMHLSLESLCEELEAASPDSTASSEVIRSENNDTITLYGHLKWEVDIPTPEVYSITMDLLKDGFIFRAESKSFVITSRVEK